MPEVNAIMKMGITYRLFFLILCATGLAIICLFLITWWNIDRGFYQYLGTVDPKKMAQIVGDLGKRYEQQGNWDFLKHSPSHWDASGAMPFLEPQTDRPPLFVPDQKETDRNVQVSPQFPEKRPDSPFVILNADKKPVRGSYPPNEVVNFHPVIVRGNIVGYVGLLSPKHFLHPIQVQFLSQQKLALGMGAVGMVLIVIIISFPLARRLVRPIRAMAAATHDIASGKYSTRISFSSADELGQLARDFNAMALTLEKHEKERRQWVADISHELRTPIAVLQGEIEALLDGIHTATPETIGSLHAETMRLKRLVEDLYQISLSDLGALTYRKENLDLLEVLGDSLESYRAKFSRKGIYLKENIYRESKVTIFADRERLKQLFANLLENSWRYTDPGGALEIRITVSGDFITIEFQDSQPGVSAQDMERLFERFYRVEGSRNRSSGGAGLGLTISKKIVDAHEGIISAHPSALGGLLIRICLPVFGGHA
jgi:two-component system, OmpR family, sensor histidine kinase BaeS